MKEVIFKYALKNAWEHGGAKIGPVVSKVLGEKPDLRGKADEVTNKTKEVIKEVNEFSKDEIESKLEDVAPELLKEEEEEKGIPDLPNAEEGEVVMRMAPFPSGPLHIGNARMTLLNDIFVKKYDGKLLLVVDDTIGSEEKPPMKEAYDWIKEDLEWLGIEYDRVYYKSERMDLYYSWAEKLIKKGAAYVCNCSSEKISDYREEGKPCEHRDRSVEKNMEEWEKMLEGSYQEGEAVLRAKTDMKNPDPAFRDRVLFRISNREHPRVGHKYHVWPMLEVSWAVDDHELGMTHVLRGKDLIIEDKMEEWFWDVFDIQNRPEFVHFGLLSVEAGVLSKSTAKREIEEDKLEGWDDPRTWSIRSLKKRGFKSESIRQFIRELGLSLADNEMPLKVLYSINRENIDEESNRYFFLKNPKKIKIKGIDDLKTEIPKHPDLDRGYRKFEMNDEVLIEEEDYEMLKKEGSIRLKHLCNVGYKNGEVIYSEDQETIYEIPKIHWLPTKDNIKAKIIMPDGEREEGAVEKHIRTEEVGSTIQFVRVGFGRIDSKRPLVVRYAHR